MIDLINSHSTMSDIDESIQYRQHLLAPINIPADRSATDPLAMQIFNEGIEVELHHSESNYD